MKHYAQLTQEQRDQIQALMKAGLNQTEIAAIVGVTNPQSAMSSVVTEVYEGIVLNRLIDYLLNVVRQRLSHVSTPKSGH